MVGAIALSSLVSACASTHRAPAPFPSPGGAAPAAVPAVPPDATPATISPSERSDADDWASTVVALALRLRGLPYRNGGADPHGFDCSGFTQYVFGQSGQRLPRETRQQFDMGTPVEAGAQQPGDLIFFSTVAPGASHVGISLGGGTFVHAPSSRGVVRVESMEVPYWSRRLVGIRRVRPE